MNAVKTPKKPFIYYLIIAATIMILLNTLVFPNVLKHQVKEVGYNVFMQMTNNQEIGSVNITDSEIFFTNKDNSQMYKTGVINDPELVDRLADFDNIQGIKQKKCLRSFIFCSAMYCQSLFLLHLADGFPKR